MGFVRRRCPGSGRCRYLGNQAFSRGQHFNGSCRESKLQFIQHGTVLHLKLTTFSFVTHFSCFAFLNLQITRLQSLKALHEQGTNKNKKKNKPYMSSLFALTPPLKVAPFSLSLPPSTKGPYTIFLQKHSSFKC